MTSPELFIIPEDIPESQRETLRRFTGLIREREDDHHVNRERIKALESRVVELVRQVEKLEGKEHSANL